MKRIEESCGETLEDHIIDAYVGLEAAGVGLACRESYHALMELAEGCRAEMGFAPYTPIGKGFAARIIDKAFKEAEVENAHTTPITAETVVDEDFEFPLGLTRN